MVTEGTSIDNGIGAQHTDWVELEMFPGSIPLFASDKDENATEAKRQTDGPKEMSLCTDGSRQDFGHTGDSVASRDPEWKRMMTYSSRNKEVFDGELYAIRKALEISLQNGGTGRKASRQQLEPQWTRVHIWADTEEAIKRLQQTDSGQDSGRQGPSSGELSGCSNAGW